ARPQPGCAPGDALKGITIRTGVLLKVVTGRVSGVHRIDPSPPPRPGDRARLLEERLSSQERTTAFLLRQAFQVKDDIVSYLQGSRGCQHGETAAQQLLENHIQTITSIVKKLSQDIEVLERQIRTRDGAAVETNFAVQSLDHKYIQGLGDLRGRVTRNARSMILDKRSRGPVNREVILALYMSQRWIPEYRTEPRALFLKEKTCCGVKKRQECDSGMRKISG
uniref:Family with sequence similarity 81 member B n=1 Tax=Otus sunia TaxID=257818 RepID=A0A8C8EBQ3_9STRI